MSRTLLIVLAAGATAALGATPAAADGKRMTLDQVTAAALANPLAAAAHHQSARARARVREARGEIFPRLAFTGFLAPSPDISCDDPTCTTTSPTDVYVNIAGVFGGAKLTVTQPLFTFGKVGAAVDGLNRAVEASEHAEDAVAGDLAYQAARAYYGLKLARELIWMLEDGQDEIAKGKKTVEEKLAAGSSDVTLQDRFRIETLQAEVGARLAEARQGEAIALAGLRALVGDDQADIDDVPLTATDFALDPADGYVDRARHDHPQLLAARAGVAGYRDKVQYERARYRPDLVLYGAVNVARAQGVDNPPSAFANDPFNTTSGQIGLVLSWKLDLLAQPARVDQAREEAARAEALFEAAGRATELGVRQAYARADQAHKRLEAARTGAKSARSWVASVLQAQAIGTSSAKDLADAYIAYFGLRGRVLQSAHDWNLAVVDLRRAVGEYAAPAARPK